MNFLKSGWKRALINYYCIKITYIEVVQIESDPATCEDEALIGAFECHVSWQARQVVAVQLNKAVELKLYDQLIKISCFRFLLFLGLIKLIFK